MTFRPVRLLCWLVSIGTPVAAAGDAKPAAKLTFEADIRPILRAHCYDCHGAAKEMKGGLDLRLVRFAVKGGESGPAIIPGEPKKSRLLQRIKAGEMPPGDKRLPAKEIAILERWIAGGAKTARPEPTSIAPGLGITPEERAWWAFQPIRRPWSNGGAPLGAGSVLVVQAGPPRPGKGVQSAHWIILPLTSQSIVGTMSILEHPCGRRVGREATGEQPDAICVTESDSIRNSQPVAVCESIAPTVLGRYRPTERQVRRGYSRPNTASTGSCRRSAAIRRRNVFMEHHGRSGERHLQ